MLDEAGPFEAGVIHDGGTRQDCSIRRISALGATLRELRKARPARRSRSSLRRATAIRRPVKWFEGGETGIRFHQPVDVLALISRKLVSQTAERRAVPRVEIRCSAFIKKGEDFLPVMLRNISAGGMQVEGDALPPLGDLHLHLHRRDHRPARRNRWRKDRLAGIELIEELSWSSIMPLGAGAGAGGGAVGASDAPARHFQIPSLLANFSPAGDPDRWYIASWATVCPGRGIDMEFEVERNRKVQLAALLMTILVVGGAIGRGAMSAAPKF